MFADALMRGMNQRQAAIHAGYSEKTAKVKGSRLAKDVDVVAYMARMRGVNQQVNRDQSDASEDKDSSELPDPLKVMAQIMTHYQLSDPKLSLEAAAKLATYICQKPNALGKKDAKAEAAKKSANRFATPPPPKLVVNNSGNT